MTASISNSSVANMSSGEPAEVSRLAHRLKGSCQIFGAHHMASICEEKIASSGQDLQVLIRNSWKRR